MKRILILAVMMSMIPGFSMLAHADLNLIGQGSSADGTYNLIYDTDLNITWYDYTNSGDTWQNQLDWADALSVTFGSNTYTDWRLPTLVDGQYEWGYDGTTTAGYNITSSEMGHLFYTELNNIGYYATDATDENDPAQPGWGLTSTGDFQNLQPTIYWSSEEYSLVPTNAWFFNFTYGKQGAYNKDDGGYHALAVRPGLAVVPEPASMLLFGTGGVVLVARRKLIRRRHG